jgi:hypothetical protein
MIKARVNGAIICLEHGSSAGYILISEFVKFSLFLIFIHVRVIYYREQS